jgi:hypothetical protein
MTNYFDVYPGTPPIGVKGDYRCSVHYKNTYRLEEAKRQASLSPVSIDEIIHHVNDFLDILGMEQVDSPRRKPSEIDYAEIKQRYHLADQRDIVWMKFTTDGYLGVVAASNDVNFDLPPSSKDYDKRITVYDPYSKKYRPAWLYNTSGILVHQLGKEWDTSFVLLFPLANLPGGLERGDVERAIGNYLIDNHVPILDFYSHNY